MTDSRAAYDPNRLPWLTDTPVRRQRGGWSAVMLWGALALLLVAAVSYWAGMESVEVDQPTARQAVPQPRATVTLPQPAGEIQRRPEAEPAARIAAEPLPPPPTIERRPSPAPQRPRTAGSEKAATSSEAAEEPAAEAAVKAKREQPAAATPPAPRVAEKSAGPLRAWPADVSEGAHGRVARIGTFSSRRQAKRAWWRIVKVYPGMRRLKATVVAAPSLRNGRTYYRLQFGTTSQAHSAVLCQRMRIVGQSCVVVGVGGD